MQLLDPPSQQVQSARPLLLMLLCAALSAAVYFAVFASVTKPLSVRVYREMVNLKRAHFAGATAPRVLVLAGSNARVSHSAEVLERELGRPVTNGGLSADTSVQLLLDLFEPLLERGDTVYMPLEYGSYLVDDRGRKVDYYYLASYEREAIGRMPFEERLRAVFSFDLPYLAGAVLETLAASGGKKARRGEMNEHGDQRGQDDAYAARFRETLARMQAPKLAPAEALRKGSATIDALRAFLVRTRQRGVLVVGGLPTTFDEVRIEPDYLAALRHLYEASGQRFLVLDNRSQYPRSAFSDSEYHLKQSQARVHSRLIADALRPLLR